MNQYNVPIASGLYLVNVNVSHGVGEVILKWFWSNETFRFNKHIDSK